MKHIIQHEHRDAVNVLNLDTGAVRIRINLLTF